MTDPEGNTTGYVYDDAGTEYLDVLEKLVGLMYEKIQPYKGS